MTNHSARKTLVKKLKSKQIPKSEIIGITGHNSEAGLDAYDSGDENEQRMISNAIDNVPTLASSVKSSFLLPSKDHALQNPTFKFFDQRTLSPPAPTFNFHNCTVNICTGPAQLQQQAQQPPLKKRKYVIYSSPESSQDD